MTIDSHVHFWNYNEVKDAWITNDMKVLRQNYLPEQVIAIAEENDIDGIVAVQADQSESETIFLKELADKNPLIKAVVGWVDLRDKNIEERLQYFSQFSIIKGWRHIAQAEADDFLLDADFQRGIHALKKYNYTYDILVYPHQLKAAVQLVAAFPQQKFIIDHCAKPQVKSKNIHDWERMMKEIAAYPNVYCKLSGLLTEAAWGEWAETDFYPYLDTAFMCFVTNRLLFGSDWPVMLLSGNYRQWKNLLETYLEDVNPVIKQQVFYDNAVNFYNL